MSAPRERVVGLEVHCQLATQSKLFCSCPASVFAAAPNAHICPVCTGQPGALPVLNRKAVESAYLAALALGCRLGGRSIFARKNYFYPDLPKGYQISQYDEPFSRDGFIDLPGPPPKRVGIERIHLEEDAGKLLHALGAEKLGYSLVDFNRAGLALIEIVSRPEMASAQEAYQYLTELKAVLQYCGVSRCDMEKGEMRCDANISVRAPGAPLGVKVEIKNLNSFKAVRDALDYEYRRQCQVLDAGGRLIQETRLWDAEASRTEPLRSKEEAHDYRYFPEPDLVPLSAAPEEVERLRRALPELPAARRRRLREAYGLSEYDAELLSSARDLADYFEAAARRAGAPLAKAVANWVQSDFLARLNAEDSSPGGCKVAPEALADLVLLIDRGTLSGKLAKEVFARMWEDGRSPGDWARELGLSQVSDPAQVGAWVREALAENPKAVADLKAGKERAVGAIVGAVMKKSRGKANPELVNRLIQEKIR